MSLVGGTRLGPYEIISPLGAGGMGEVYKARDTRLGRDVAVKVLPAEFSQDPVRLRRFEHEAKALAALNHPNILFVLDVGKQGSTPYVVTELLEGQSLRQLLASGPLSVHRAAEIAAQIARGLAAAHAKGVVHRDLKPGNVYVTKDGQVKVLDFGLARLARPAASRESQLSKEATAEPATGPGVTMGTAGYMSPEQVRGGETDARSDLFSLGVVLYEMLSGRRPFERDSSIETMNAILKEDPPELSRPDAPLPPGLVRIVEHSLEKSPDARFQSARDVAFDLEALSGPSSTGQARPVMAGRGAFFGRRALALGVLGLVLLLAAVIGGAFTVGRRSAKPAQPTFMRLTYRQGWLDAARFLPDGQTVAYSAEWEAKPSELFSVRVDSPESRALGYSDAMLVAASPRGELGLLEHRTYGSGGVWRTGTLATVPFSGGSPRPLQENVSFADWSPDGKDLALVRQTETGQQLECPPGKVLCKTAGLLSHPRVSPTGEWVAFLAHPLRGDTGGTVEVVDRRGTRRTLAGPYPAGVEGLAWSPGGDEVWFTAVVAGPISQTSSLIAVSPGGRQRLVLTQPRLFRLHDIARDGRALISSDVFRLSLFYYQLADAAPRALPWLDTSMVDDISPDGRAVLFVENPSIGNSPYWYYLRATDGSPPVKIHEGSPGWMAFSPDGQHIVITQSEPPEIYVYPVGAGEPAVLKLQGFTLQGAQLLPDGKTIYFGGHEPSKPWRIWRTDLSGTKPVPVTPEGVKGDGTPDGRFYLQGDKLYSLDGGTPVTVMGLLPGDHFAGWGADGSMFLWRPLPLPIQVFRLDPRTGERHLLREFMPPDPVGYLGGNLRVAADGKSFAVNIWQRLAELYLVEGLK